MDADIRGAVWRQYGAAIDMLENAISACPDEIWGDQSRKPQYWYFAFHTLFFLDYYLSDSEDGFEPPSPFGLTELDPSGAMPERVYTREELLSYLKFGRDKCRARIENMTAAQAHQPSVMRKGITEFELLLYTMRHVQHHAAQLNLILRQTIDSAPRWVSVARN